MSDTETTNREAMLAIARRHRDGEIDTNAAVDQLGAVSQLSFTGRTGLLGELLDELALSDLASTETTTEDPREGWLRRHNKTARQEVVDDLLTVLQAGLDHAEEGTCNGLYARDWPRERLTAAATADGNAQGWREALGMVRRHRRTREEYYLFDCEISRLTVSETNLACARHRDVCALCRDDDEEKWRLARERDRLANEVARLKVMIGKLRGQI